MATRRSPRRTSSEAPPAQTPARLETPESTQEAIRAWMDLDYLPPLGRPSESYLNVLDAIAEGLTLDEDMIADVARGVVAESATRTVTASRDMTLEVGDGHVLIAADDVEVTMFSPEGNDGAECRIISGPYTGTSVVGDIAGQRSVAFGARSCVTLRSNDTSWDIV